MRMPLAALILLAIGSALLLTLALPSFSLGWLGGVALAPLFIALQGRSLLAGAALGGLFGWIFGAASFFWINSIPDINPLRFALLVTAFSVYYLAFGLLYSVASRAFGRWMILAAPAIWVACEYARGSMAFLAYPWNFLGHSQHALLPVIQIADVTGAYGVSFLLAMASQLASELPDGRRDRTRLWANAACFALVLGTTLLYGVHRLNDAPSGPRVRVAVVQANVATHSRMSAEEQNAHLSAYARLTLGVLQDRPQLIVWPSSSLPGPISFWMIRLYVSDLAHRAGVPLLVGGAGGDKFAPARVGELPYSNSEILVSPKGALVGQYNKVHLTPFTEQVPLQGLVSWPRWMTTLDKSFVPGDRFTLFEVAGARFGAPICWENSFPDVFRRFVLEGADFMVSVTNEAVFGRTSGPHQTVAMNVFRAVENRVAVARAATTGVSAFIDSRGRIVSKIAGIDGQDVFVSGARVWDVPLASERSVYTRYGDWFAMACAIATALITIGTLLRRRRGPGPGTSSH